MASNSFVDDFVSLFSVALEQHVEKGENLDTLSNLARDTLVRHMAQSTVPKAPRAPRAPRAPKRSAEASAETSSTTTAATTNTTTTTAPATTTEPETRSRKSHTKRAEKPNHLKKMNGYNLFVQHTMNTDPVISQKQTKNEAGEVSGMSSKDKMKSCGVAWKALSPAECEQWKQRSVGYNFYVQTTMGDPDTTGASFNDRLATCQAFWNGLSADDQASWVARGVAAASAAEAAQQAAAPVQATA